MTLLQPRVSAQSLSLSNLAAAAVSAAPVFPLGSGPPVLSPPPHAGEEHPALPAGFSNTCLKVFLLCCCRTQFG